MTGRHLGEEFSVTVQALLKALPVGQIATSPIACCRIDDDLAEVLERPEWLGYDTIGVTHGSGIVGLLRRASTKARTGSVRPRMEPIPTAQVMDSGEPLTTAIRLLARSEPLFVGQGGDVLGIVTRSDLLRLPVRLFCFSFVAQLELTLAKAITQNAGGDETAWLGLLAAPRLERLEKLRQDLKSHRMDPSPVELLELCDKRVVARKLLKLPGKFEDDLKSIEKRLRNPVAHASDFLGRQKDAGALLQNLQACFHWSQTLRLRYRLSAGGFTPLEEIGRTLFGDAFDVERSSWDSC